MKINLIGQESASLILNAQLEAFERDKKFAASLIVSGAAGIGKSFVSTAFSESLVESKFVDSACILKTGVITELAITTGETTKQFIEAMRNSACGIPSVIICDEAQEWKNLGEAMSRIFKNVVFGSGEGWKGTGTFEFLGETIAFDRSYLCFILATNFPEKIQKGNANAVERRFAHIQLVRYKGATMRKLIAPYFRHKGVTFDDSIKKHLEKLNRGTFEALDEIIRKLGLTENAHLSEAKLLGALPLLKHTLRGFTTLEIKALRWIYEGKEPPTFANFKKNFPTLDADELLRHSKAQETKTKGSAELVNTPFLMLGKGHYMLTQTAKDFISKNKELFDSIA